jgi:predicted dehydrogenase
MKLALIGAGNRITFQYAINLEKSFADKVEMVGIYDLNPIRSKRLSERLNRPIPVFDDPKRMILEAKPDTVLIGSIDSTHDVYIELAMSLGCDVICEKPITISPEKAQRIRAIQKSTQKKLTITFNYRFTLFATMIKEALRDHSVGEIQSIHFEWMLDQAHGADYFRRWHRQKKNSGGLAIHKATHHFDLVNWLVGSKPHHVYANGALKFYGSKNSDFYGAHCRVCDHKNECPFFKDYSSDAEIKGMYYEGEHIDGYYRDGCVFSPDIDIEDTISALVVYENGVDLTYKLVAYAPYEGYRLTITGNKGRLEAEDFHGLIGPYANQQIYHLTHFDQKGNPRNITIPIETGSHGGGDDRMMRMIFSGEQIQDPLGHMADIEAGFNAAYIGMAINQSIAENRVVRIEEFGEIGG